MSNGAVSGERVSPLASSFALLGGPAAWFTQVCAGFAMTSWPCFPGDQHRLQPLEGYQWTHAATDVLLMICILVALAAALTGWRLLQRIRTQASAAPPRALDTTMHRTGFLALWSVVGGTGFAVATAFTAVALILLPRCGG